MRIQQLNLDELNPDGHALIAIHALDDSYLARCSCGYVEEAPTKRSARARFTWHRRRAARASP